MRTRSLFLIFILSLLQANAQEIDWISFEEAIALNKENPKQIVIDVYTDWCGYCKKMDRDTYENNVIIDLINDNFYAVKLNAEQKESFTYKGKEYKFIAQGRKGYNELAANLLHGKMSYPSTVFMDENEQLIQNIPGYLSPQLLEPILVFMSEKKYLEQTWEEFREDFSSTL